MPDAELPVSLDTEMNQPWWFSDCEVIENYVAPHAPKGEVSRCVVRHVPTGMFLRHSKGPRQGHGWDIYGDDYLNDNLARLAIHQAPPPWKTTPPEDVSQMRTMEAKVNELRRKVATLTAELAAVTKANDRLRGRLREVHKASDV